MGCRFWLWHVIFLIPLAGKQNWNTATKEDECWKGCCRTFGAILPASNPPPHLDKWRKWGLERLGNLLKVIQMSFIMMTYFNVVLDSINSLISLHNLSSPGRRLYYPHFTDNETEVQRKDVACTRSHRDSVNLLNPGEQERDLREEHVALPLNKCIPTCSWWIYIWGAIQDCK